jgi:putative ABC transport system permease protein
LIRLFLIAARNLKRSWFRTIFTVAGATVALIAFMMLRTILWAWTAGQTYAASDRLGTRHKVSFIFQLPKHYIDDVRGVPGVKDATWANWFGAKIPTKPDEFFANLAVDPVSYLRVVDEITISPDEKTRWLGDRQGAVVGRALARKMGWKVGQKVTLEGTIYPGNWEYNIDAIYTASRKSLDESQFFFHWDYLNDTLEADRKDQIGWIMSRITEPSQSGEISASIDRIFDSRDIQTATMSERAMQAGFLAMFSAILTVLDIVSIIILGIMLLILGNTIAMGVRERTREYAVLRAIGFEPWHVRFFVIAEAVTLGILCGAVGVAIAVPFIDNVVGRGIEENMGAWFPYFKLQPSIAGLAFLIAIALATGASLLPSIQAGRVSVTDALRRVG